MIWKQTALPTICLTSSLIHHAVITDWSIHTLQCSYQVLWTVLHNLKLAAHMQMGTHRPWQHVNIKCLPYFVFRKESKPKMICTLITLKKYHIKSNSVCDLGTYVCCCVTRCSTVNLLVAVYHIGRLGSRNGHPLNASPCSPASCSRLVGHFSQPSLYLLIPEFSLLLQPSLHTVTQEKQQHTLSFFLK